MVWFEASSRTSRTSGTSTCQARAEDLEAGRSPGESWQAITPELTDARDDASNHTM